MALKGELLSADLSNVFQMLAMNGKRGLLTVQDRVNPVARRRFFLDAQTVLPAEPIAQRPSLAMLVEMGRLPYELYVSAMQRATRFSSDPWGILKAQGTLTDADIEAFRARASNEALLEVFLWRDIRFTLDETVSRSPQGDVAPIQIDHVVMEAARRQDEWRHVVEAVGSHREVFRQCSDSSDLSELAPVERIVYEFINGVDAATEIETKCELPRYHVELCMASLLRRGVVSKLSPHELIICGDGLIQANRTREAIRLFHCALRSDRNSIAIHQRLTDAHVKIGEYARACGHLRYCALLELSEGRRRESLSLLQQAWKLLPSQFSTLERILSILIEDHRVLTREDRTCVADGRRLLQVWHDTNELDRAVELASRLWEIDQSDREVLHTAARLNMRLGRHDEAVKSYVALAELFRADHNLRAALEIYRTIASMGGAYAHAYQDSIDDLKRAMEVVATRKRRGKTVRFTILATIVLVVFYAGYAWFGQQLVRELDERVAADPASRDARASDYQAAAFWFKLAPAGAHAEQRAQAMLAEAEAERERLRARNDALAMKMATEHRAAEAAVAEGMRMVKAGDLAGATRKIKQGLDTFPSKESPAASRAAKALADVERYMAGGHALLEEARSIEGSDPDAAFRLRLKALREYELLAEVRALKLALRIECVPFDAKVVVQGSPVEHTPPIGIEVGGQGLLAVQAKAQGYLPRSFSLALPPEFATWTLVLEKNPKTTLKTSEPLTSVTPVNAQQALVAARNGPLFLVDVASGQIAKKFKADAIDSQSRAPVVSGNHALCLLDDGRARIVHTSTMREVATVRLPARAGFRPLPIEQGFLIIDSDNRVAIVGRDGKVVRRFQLPTNVVVRDAALVGSLVYLAAGEVGTLSVDPAVDDSLRSVNPKFAAALAAGTGKTLLVHRPQVGVVSFNPVTGAEKVLVQHPGDRARFHRIDASRCAVLFDGELVFLFEQNVAGRTKVAGLRPETPVVIDAESAGAGVIVEGWCSVYNFADGRCIAGYTCEKGASPAFVQRTFINVHQDGRITLTP